jgi:hypothetical protein
LSARNFSLPGTDVHPHRQTEFALRGDRRFDRGSRRGEGGQYTVAGIFECPAAVDLDRRSKYGIVLCQRDAHCLGFILPALGGALDVGDQKRNSPNRRLEHLAVLPGALAASNYTLKCCLADLRSKDLRYNRVLKAAARRKWR